MKIMRGSTRRWSVAAVMAALLVITTLVSAAGVGETVLISRSTAGVESDSVSNYVKVIPYADDLTDVQLSTFSSRATNLIDEYSDPESYWDVFVQNNANSQTNWYSPTSTLEFDGDSIFPIMSENGRYLAFQSGAEDLSLLATPEYSLLLRETDIFLADLDNGGMTSRVSVGLNTSEPNGDSGYNRCTVSGGAPVCEKYANGSTRPNLILPHPVASVLPLGGGIVAVAFESLAWNLSYDDANGYIKDIFVRNMFSAEDDIVLLSRAYNTVNGTYTAAANGESYHPVLAGSNGRYLVFVSRATNLVPGYTADDYSEDILPGPGELPVLRRGNIFLLDRDKDNDGTLDEFAQVGGVEIKLLSKGIDNLPGNGLSEYPAVTYEAGKFSIAFQSKASNLVINDTNTFSDIFLYHYLIDDYEIERISLSSEVSGQREQANQASYSPSISGNGRVIAFTSYASNLIDGDTNDFCDFTVEGQPSTSCPDIYVSDWLAHQTWRVSVTTDGRQADGNSGFSSINYSGQFVYFASFANLTGDGEYMGAIMRIFMRNQGNPPGNPNIQPTSHNFGVLEPGSSADRTFNITFLADLSVEQLSLVTGTHFELLDDTCTSDTQYSAGDTCSFTVRFNAPTGQPPAEHFSDILLVQLTDPNPLMPPSRTLNVAVDGTLADHNLIVTGDVLEREASHGEMVSYELLVTNVGNIADAYHVEVIGADWQTVPQIIDIPSMAPGATAPLVVDVTLPEHGFNPLTDQVTIRVTSTVDPNATRDIVLTTHLIHAILYMPLINR